MPSYFTLVRIAAKGWRRLPPAQRRKVLLAAGKQARKHGPTVIRAVRTARRLK